MEKKKKKLGEILVEEGLIDVYQLQSALAHQKQWGGKLGQILVKLGFLTEEELLGFLSYYFKIPNVDLKKVAIPPSVIKLVPEDIARKYNVLPLTVKDELGRKILYLATADPTNVVAIDELEFALGMPIRPVLASDNLIAEAIEFYYGGRGLFRPDRDAVPSNKLNFTSLVRKPGKMVKEEEKKEESLDDSTIFIFANGKEQVINLEDEGMNRVDTSEKVTEKIEEGKTAQTDQMMVRLNQIYALMQDLNSKINALAKLLINKGVIGKEEYLAMYRREKSRKSSR